MKIFSLVEFMNEDFSHASELIENLLCKKDFHLLTAPAKAGKSFLAMNLALALCSGKDFLGFKTRKSRVLYLQTEIGDLPLQERFKSLVGAFQTNAEDMANLFICNARIKIDKPEGLNQLRQLTKQARPDVIILDPLYTLHNSDESSASAMGSMLSALKALLIELNIACFLIHHQGKQYEGKSSSTVHKARGSSAFGDVPDGLLSLADKENGLASLEVVLRNYKPPGTLYLKKTENMVFERVHGTSDSFIDLNFHTVVLELLNTHPGIKKSELTSLLKNKLSKSESTIHKRLADLTRVGAIKTEKTGKEVSYFSVALEQHPQQQPLKGCVDDDVQS